MSRELEDRLQEALDATGHSLSELKTEIAGQPELEAMVALDAALRSIPLVEFDLSASVLARLDEEFEEIPGLFDAPSFETDVAPELGVTGNTSSATPPISLDEVRRKRSAAPFLLSAAAVIGLVAAGTLMTLNSPADMSMEAASQAATASVSGMPESYAEERMAEPEAPAERADLGELAEASASSAPSAPSEPIVVAAADMLRPTGAADPAADPVADYEAQGELGMPAPAAPAVSRAMSMSARGAIALPEPTEAGAEEELSASQRRTLARAESCLPDHVRITRVRQSADGQRVVGIETSEALSDSVDACVAGVLETFPQARRRARQRPATTRSPASAIDK